MENNTVCIQVKTPKLISARRVALRMSIIRPLQIHSNSCRPIGFEEGSRNKRDVPMSAPLAALDNGNGRKATRKSHFLH